MVLINPTAPICLSLPGTVCLGDVNPTATQFSQTQRRRWRRRRRRRRQ